MNPQNIQWRKSLPARIVSVVLSILLLWATIACLLLVCVCLPLSAYSHSTVPYDTLLVSTYEGNHTDTNDNMENLLRNYIAVTCRNSTVGMEIYSKYFTHEATNLRFTVVNAEGEVLLTTNTEELNESTALASAHEFVNIKTGEERYEVKENFATLQDIFRTSLTQYMREADDYKHWYFTDSIVDTAYKSGLQATVYRKVPQDMLYFDSMAEAKNFDYIGTYGSNTTWQIVLPEASDSSDNSGSGSFATTTMTGHSAPIEVQVFYNERSDEHFTLMEYYDYLAEGHRVELADAGLAKAIENGLDITIVGEAAQFERYDLYLYLPRELAVDDAFASNIRLAEMLFSYRYILLGGVFICGLLTIASLTGMCKVAGYVHDKDEPVCGWMHRIPYELLVAITVGVLWLAAITIEEVYYFSFSWKGTGVYIGGILLSLCAGAIYLLYTTAVRVKTKRFWESFATVRFLRFIYRLCCNRVGICILTAVAAVGLYIINALGVVSGEFFVLIPILMFDALVLLGIFYCIYAYEVLRSYTKRMEQGDFTLPEPMIPLVGIFKKHADSLAKVNKGIAISVAEQTKAERMRTALITNVSHDLKTPLTSIVNYVDLMKREPIENPTVTEYLDVLERQSARLKKLTEDLVEASKASTGNITVDLQPTCVQVLAEQLMAEFEPRFSVKQLQMIVDMPQEELFVAADSRLIWRVFDNLLGNICKYAMPGTRVYLDVIKGEGSVCITLRNISQAVLHISPDELTERFVRGDASRNTEGSGLGLSIAKDLVRLQHGELKLQIDGDLFKAMVTLPMTAAPVRENVDL